MIRTQKEILHAALIKAAFGPKKYGICSHVLEHAPIGQHTVYARILRDLMETWPKYSGNPYYPVPHPIHHPEFAYDAAYNKRWDPTTEYGANRLELLEYLITETANK